MMQSRRGVLAAAMSAAAVGVGGRAARAAAWQPSRTIELVVPSGAGGGLDVTGRTLQRMMHDMAVTNEAVQVVNKPGGNGALGILYANQHRGDGHFITVQSPALLINPLEGIGAVGLKNVTPVATLVDEQIFFSVAADGPVKTGKDLAAMLGKDPASVPIGMSGAAGGHSHIAIASVAKRAGADPRSLKLVAFNGGGEAVTALMGGHVLLTVTPASSILGPAAAGRVRVIAISAAQRLDGDFSSVPTWRELGVDAVVSSWRALAGPVGMNQAQLAWWDDTLKKVVKDPQWMTFVQRNQWSADYRDSADTARFFESETKSYADILQELGLLKVS